MKGSTALIAAGVLALVAGIAALAFPLPASLAVTALVGWAFVISGALGLWAVFSADRMPHRGWAGFLGLLNLVVGVWMLAQPLAAMISLTLVVGAMFVASGAARLWLGLSAHRGRPGRWMILLSGLISTALGLYILVRLPAASTVALGVLVAVELIVVGATLLPLGVALRRLGRM